MRKKKLLLLFLLFGIHESFGQNMDGTKGIQGKDKPNSPTEQKGGSNIINVDPFTGVGNVNIPIYDYTVDGLDLGVSLSYNTKGIKVDDLASSVGLGWELNTGGSIERITHGIEDEIALESIDTSLYLGYGGAWVDRDLYRWGTQASERIETQHDLFIANIAGRNIQFAMDTLNHAIIATMPKSEIRIKASVTGNNSYFGNGGSQNIAHKDFRDIFFHSASTSETTNVLNFTIIDERGNRFIFERGDYRFIEYSDIPNTIAEYWFVPSRWVLKKVITYTGAEINYTYTYSDASYTQSRNEKVRENYMPNDPQFGFSTPEIAEEDWTGKVAHLTSISYPNGVTVNFDASYSNSRCDYTGAFRLNNIEVNSQYDNSVRNTIRYKFNYSYFHTPETNNTNPDVALPSSPCTDMYLTTSKDALRLKLNSIDKIGIDNATTESLYMFEYNLTPLPKRLSPQRDLYGYYNGATTTPLILNGNYYYLSVPLHTAFSVTYGTSRASDQTPYIVNIKAGMLKKIKNGNKGEIEIEYKKPVLDANDQKQYNGRYCGTGTSILQGNDMYIVDPDLEGVNETDGLVIDKLIFRDGFNAENDYYIKYDYAGGRRFYMGGYMWYPTKIEAVNGMVLEKYYTNYFLAAQDYLNGSNHGYTWVSVSEYNSNTNERLSKTLFTYSNLIRPTNFTDMYDVDYINSISGIMSQSFSRLTLYTGLLYHTAYRSGIWKSAMGLLLQETKYNQADSVISLTTNRYDINALNAPTEHTSVPSNHQASVSNAPTKFSFQYHNTNYNNGWADGYADATSGYVFASGHHRITRSIQSVYSGRDSVSTEHKYTYDLSDNLKSDTWTDSRGDTYRKEYIYCSDINNLTNCNDDLIQFQLGERLLKIDPSNSNNNKLVSHNLVRPYITSTSPLYYANTNPKTICTVRFPSIFAGTLNTPVAVSQAITEETNAVVWNATGQSTLKKVKAYTQYDDKNNIVEVKYNENEIYDSYIWDTRIGQKIAEISNAKHADIAYSSFEGLADPNVSTYGRGNWTMEPGHVTLAKFTSVGSAITGKYCYDLDYTNSSSILQKALPAGKEYILTFWADEEPVVKLDNAIIVTSMQLSNNAGWKLYTAYITTGSNGGNLTINELEPPTSGGGGSPTMRNAGYIDELRLYPSDASMTTYTYEPLLGVSSMCDSRNNIVYYDYDVMGRLQYTRDFDGNIIQKNVYVNQGANN